MSRSLLLALAVMLLPCVARAADDVEAKQRFDKHVESQASAIRESEKLLIYEGLPHHFAEGDLLEKELKSKKTVKLHKFPFYETPITPNQELAKELTALCSRKASYEFNNGEMKLCGGYHPDWCLEFSKGKEKYYVSICFGCHEAHLVGPQLSTRVDLDDKAYKKLGDLLPRLRKNRPVSEDEQ